MSLGQNIAFARKRNSLSQEEMANRLNVSRQSVSLWENDQTTPTLDKLNELANILSVSIDQLFGRSSFETKIELNNTTEKSTNKRGSVFSKITFIVLCLGVLLWMIPPFSIIVNIGTLTISILNKIFNRRQFSSTIYLVVACVFFIACFIYLII